ncbi:Ig-like domain-containing protein, partial [Aeromonas cavernicola]
TITNAVVTELQITPQDSSLAIGLSEQLKAEAILSDGQVLNVTANTAVSWSSSNPAVATINSSGTDKGIVTGVSAGSVTITASGEANGQRFSATAQVTITSAVMTELQITPQDSSLAIGLSERLKGEAILSDGQVLDVTANDAVSWSSSNPAVATIISSGANKGMVTGVSAGSVTITASGEANGQRFSATAEVEVKAPLALFTPPDTNNARTWKDADAYCKGLTPAARLPTVAELQNLYIQSTSATSINQQDNFEMCDVHGWPLDFARCGGITSYYWTNTLGSFGLYNLVSLARGHNASAGYSNDNSLHHVACIR